jgi:hypothetical protein
MRLERSADLIDQDRCADIRVRSRPAVWPN